MNDVRLTSEEIEAWSVPDPPARVTWAGAIYYDTLVEFLDFLRFIGNLAKYDDEDRVKKEALWLTVTDEVDTNEWHARRQSAADPDRSQRELEDITERRVRKLTSKGLEALAGYLAKINLPMLLEEPVKGRAILAIRQRNLVVHSRGLVDRRWLSQFGESGGALGAAVELDRDDDLGGALRVFNQLVNRLDAAAIDRHGLDTVPRRRLSDSLGEVPRRPSQLRDRGLLADRSAVRRPSDQ